MNKLIFNKSKPTHFKYIFFNQRQFATKEKTPWQHMQKHEFPLNFCNYNNMVYDI